MDVSLKAGIQQDTVVHTPTTIIEEKPMCPCNSANSQPGSISHLYSYAISGQAPNKSSPAAQCKIHAAPYPQDGDIHNGAPSPPQPAAGGTPSTGIDPSVLMGLLQILTMLVEMFKNSVAGGGGNASPNTSVSPASFVAAQPEQRTGAAPPPAAGINEAPSAPQGTTKKGGLSDRAKHANPEVGKWNNEIAAAAHATGLDPDLIGAQIWAESRGNLDTHTRNVDGTIDHGLIQIGAERWRRDIVPKLSAEDKLRIKEATGKDAENLDVTQALDNVVAGAFHTKACIAREGNFERGLRYYNSGNAANAGSSGYVNNVKEYMRELKAGERLQQDPYNGTFGSGHGGQI